jgi:hypothetical protein
VVVVVVGGGGGPGLPGTAGVLGRASGLNLLTIIINPQFIFDLTTFQDFQRTWTG